MEIVYFIAIRLGFSHPPVIRVLFLFRVCMCVVYSSVIEFM